MFMQTHKFYDCNKPMYILKWMNLNHALKMNAVQTYCLSTNKAFK